MRARFGEQSREHVIQRWYRHSHSNPDKPPYEIQLHNDGFLTCNCNGWTRRNTRDCTHVKVLQAEAQRFLDRYTGRTETPSREKPVERHIESKKKTGRYIQLGGDWT